MGGFEGQKVIHTELGITDVLYICNGLVNLVSTSHIRGCYGSKVKERLTMRLGCGFAHAFTCSTDLSMLND
jgi:hypothetical protein